AEAGWLGARPRSSVGGALRRGRSAGVRDGVRSPLRGAPRRRPCPFGWDAASPDCRRRVGRSNGRARQATRRAAGKARADDGTHTGLPRRAAYSLPLDPFPAADPSSGSDPLLIPLATGPRSKYRRAKPLQPHVVPGLFAVRLLRATRTLSRPVLAFAMRTDPHTVRAWEGVTRNLEHLARIPGTRFVTAGEAARSTTV